MVVDEFTKVRPNNPLARFLPALARLKMRGDVFTGLNGFEAEVRKLAKDKDFIDTQWKVCDDQYNQPSMEWCKRIQCQHALTKAELHDALVNHGEGLGSKFSVDYIFQAAERAVGGTPRTGVEETRWLAAFLKARLDLLRSWDHTSAVSFRRVTMYQRLLELRNLNLDGPIYIDMQRRPEKDAAGQPVWQILDAYYGTFIVYEKPLPDRQLLLVM